SDWATTIQAWVYNKTGTDTALVANAAKLVVGDTASATDLYRANLVKQVISKVGSQSYYLDSAQRLAYTNEYEAIQQRQISQSVQSSFFLETAPAIITWFEVFYFLLSRLFIPVMLALGKMGLSMAMKCFMFILAVNFWPLIQIGVNVYIRHYLSKLMCGTAGYDGISASCLTNSTVAAKFSIASLGGMDASYTTLQTFVSTAQQFKQCCRRWR
ncbi:MAG: conjugal transfer protein TraG, partial [Shewanella fodinae]|nr:conjugal transfer protein TraG [Shewanella fodinae]